MTFCQGQQWLSRWQWPHLKHLFFFTKWTEMKHVCLKCMKKNMSSRNLNRCDSALKKHRRAGSHPSLGGKIGSRRKSQKIRFLRSFTTYLCHIISNRFHNRFFVDFIYFIISFSLFGIIKDRRYYIILYVSTLIWIWWYIFLRTWLFDSLFEPWNWQNILKKIM